MRKTILQIILILSGFSVSFAQTEKKENIKISMDKNIPEFTLPPIDSINPTRINEKASMYKNVIIQKDTITINDVNETVKENVSILKSEGKKE